MAGRWSRTTWLNGLAALLVGAAVLMRLLDAHLPPDIWRIELWLIGIGVVYAVAVLYASGTQWGHRAGVQLAIVALNTLGAVAVLTVAGPWIDNLAPLASLVALAFFLNVAALRAPRHIFLAGAITGGGAAVIWLEMLFRLHRAPLEVLLWAALIAGIAIFFAVAVIRTSDRLKRQARRTNAIAIAAQRVGLSTDLNGVAAAVLTACHEVFPRADFGGVLVFDHQTEKLRSLPVCMVAGEVAELPSVADFDLSPGEGVAGKVFLAAEPRCWGTPGEVLAEHGNMRDGTREQIVAVTGGVRSAAAAPLKLPDRGVIGVLTLGSTHSQRVWGAADLVVIQGLAEQAALGVERARLYQEQRAQALTDPLTGLANYRQLNNVLTQEVARARRANSQVGVVFCDLDGFKRVNDERGHHTGDGVLRLLARTLSEVLRAEDLAARYGGDEFVCILPGADLVQAVQVSERIADRFGELLGADPELRDVRTHPSCGCALFPQHGSTADAVLAAADSALIKAKHAVPQAHVEPG